MKVILLKDVKTLGKRGDVVEASDGYARNVLIPKKMGVEANKKNMNDLKLQQQHADKVAKENLEAAQAMAKEISEWLVETKIRTGEGGRTFGSVSSKEICIAVKEQYHVDLDKKKVAAIAEELAGMWEVTYYHRELRPGVKETLEALQQRGYRLGVISNTASLYSVFDVLERYGIRDYFSDVTLSSVTGYRKPNPGIFKIALRQMQARPEQCAYVGDTLSRDVIGAKRLQFGAAIQIRSFLSAQKDADVTGDWKPDHVIGSIADLVDYLDGVNQTRHLAAAGS